MDAPDDGGDDTPDAGGDDPLAGGDDNPDDAPEDLEDGAPDDGDDGQPEEPDMDAPDDGGDDTPDAGGDDGDMEPDDLSGGDDGGSDAGGDDGDMEPDDLSDGGDGGDGGDDTPDAGDSEDGSDGGDSGDSSDGGSEGEIEGIENEIFEDLSDEQKAIRTKELKDRFIELYNVTLAFKEKVDYVKKNSDNMKVITKVSKSLDKLSDMISYYITKTFNTKSYIENKSDFYYCLWVLDRLNELMSTLAPKEPMKK